MMKTYHLFLFLSVLTLSLTACREEEEHVGSGNIIVVNEGNFGTGNGSLSLYDPATHAVNNQAFKQMNNREIEASIQSVSINGNKAFVICNAPDKIEIIDPETLEALAAPIEEENMVSPRYFAAVGNKGYVSAWGPFDDAFNLKNSKILVVDLTNLSLMKEIETNSGPEDLLAIGNKVFVANSFTNTLSVINAQADEIDTILLTPTGPTQMELDHKDFIWVSTTGGFGGTPQFLQIDPGTYEVKQSISAEGTGANGKFTMNANRDSLFFIGAAPFPATETAIYAMSMDAPVVPDEALIHGHNFYGIGIDPRTNILYVGDANAFQGEGTVLRYNTNSKLIDNFPAGVVPNGFVFQ